MIDMNSTNSQARESAEQTIHTAIRSALFETENATNIQEVILSLQTASFLALWRNDNLVGNVDLPYLIRSSYGGFKASLRYNASLRSITDITLEMGDRNITFETTFTREIISKLELFYFGDTP